MHGQSQGASKAAQATAPAPATQRLVLQPLSLTFIGEEAGVGRRYECVALVEGVYQPGLGNPAGSRIFFPAEVIKRLAPTLDGKPVNLQHSHDMNDEVGVVETPFMDADGKRLRCTVFLQQMRPRYMDAIGFVESRKDAGLVPNVSVEFTQQMYREAMPNERNAFDKALVDGSFAGIAILPQGACNDGAGCGIGLAAPAAKAPCTHGCLPVLALQGIGQHDKERTNMGDTPNGGVVGLCPADAAALQARATALEADLNKTKLALSAKEQEVVALTKQVEGYETAERLALTEALTRTLPAGTDMKSVVGENPSVGDLMLALKTAEALKPDLGLAEGASGGRKTANPARDNGAANGDLALAKAKETHLLALRAKYGLKEAKESKLPRAMQRNTDRILAKEAPVRA